jgi:hypothetical protein
MDICSAQGKITLGAKISPGPGSHKVLVDLLTSVARFWRIVAIWEKMIPNLFEKELGM